MRIIVNSAWKKMKDGDTVYFKGEAYEIGDDAYKSVEDAVMNGHYTEEDQLVIVDKKLSSPVKGHNIAKAATDIFSAEETETESDKTTTTVTKFAAAAGGTASFKNAGAELNGFEKVTAQNAGGTFYGGKQDVNVTEKVTDDVDMDFTSDELIGSTSSVASGSLKVTGASAVAKAEVSVGAIQDESGQAAEALEDFEEIDLGDASFANLSLTYATIGYANGGSITGKETHKYSNSKGEKITKEFSSTESRKLGSGTADLTNSDAVELKGFKTVNVTAFKSNATIGSVKSGTKDETDTSKASFEDEKSSSIIQTEKETKSVAGTVKLAGRNLTTQAVTLTGRIEKASAITMKNVIMTGDDTKIKAGNETENESLSISVQQQDETAALTASYSDDESFTAAGSLTAEKSVVALASSAEGLKDVSIASSTVNGTFNAVNSNVKYTKQETGSAIAGISENQEADYVSKFGVYGDSLKLLDNELVKGDETVAYSYEYTVKEEASVGGAKFQIAGKTAEASIVTARGYKSVSLDNSNQAVVLTATLDNGNATQTVNESGKVSYTPDSSYSKTHKSTESVKVVGNATIKGNVTAAVNSFASVRISGANAVLNGFAGSYDSNDSTDESWDVKASDDDPIGNYSYSFTSTDKGVSSLDASKMTLSSGDAPFTALKSAKLQNIAGNAAFTGSIDTSWKETQKYTWAAEDISEAAALAVPADPTDATVTDWSYSNESQSSASGTFTLTNAKEILTLNSVDAFQSVKISGYIGKTTVNGVNGSDTTTNQQTHVLSVKGEKGTYSRSISASSQAATTLEINKATLNGAFSNLKSAKATAVAGVANFSASLDTESKDSLKAEWKADEITVAQLYEEWNPYNEAITYFNQTSESKSSVVGTLTLSSTSQDAVLTALSAVNFKTVNLTFTGSVEGSLNVQGNTTHKSSWTRTASDTEITDDISDTSTDSAVATLKVTGKKAAPAVINLTNEQPNMAYSSVTLTDARLVGEETSIAAYDQNSSRKEFKSYSLSSDEVAYKLDRTYSRSGKGTFTATISGNGNGLKPYDGGLNGFKSVTLKNNASIGNVDNTSSVGLDDVVYVAFTEEYDPESLENTGKIAMSGNISGSYTKITDGDVSAQWNGNSSRTASGSFTQTATMAGVTAGNITGYDKVSLDSIATAGILNGENVKSTRVATYKYTDYELVTNTDVTTTERTASASATVSGKKFNGQMQTAIVGEISGYKTVTIKNAAVSNGINVSNSKSIMTSDELSDFQLTSQSTQTAIGTLTATDSSITGNVSGFQTVKLSNTVTSEEPSNFTGGNTSYLVKFQDEEPILSYGEETATGSLTADARQNNTAYTIGDVTGYQKVTLTNYSAGIVSVGFVETDLEDPITATYVKKTDANAAEAIPASWEKAAKTKSNTFTATASIWKANTATVSVGDVAGYAKVEASNLESIGSIDNAVITDNFGVSHYGDWTASSTAEEDAYTAIKVTTGTSATIKGQSAFGTNVTGNVAGYAKISMNKVILGGEDPVLYAAGDYSYTTNTDKNGTVIATESTKSNGTLQITNATAVDGAFIDMTGFKAISANINSAVTIGDIRGGNSDYKYVDNILNSFTSTLAGSVDLTTSEGVVTGQVNGFESVTFTDTNFTGENARIMGHDKNAKGEYAAKTKITFIDSDSNGLGQTIGGQIIDAKEIVFKSNADEEVDFEITSLVDSWLGSDTKISFTKSQAEVDLSNFQLDEGDVITLSRDSTIILSGDLNDLAAYFEKMSGSKFSGSGTIAFSGVTVDDVEYALDNADITYAKSITFTELA